MYNFFSCYVLLSSIYVNAQTQVSFFKCFTSKGEYLYFNQKEKAKNLFLCKIEIMKVFGKLPITSFI